MTRVSVLRLSLCFFLQCLYQAQGFELSQPLRKTFSPFGLRQSPIEFDVECMSLVLYDRGLETEYVPASAKLVLFFTSPPGSFTHRNRRLYLQQLHFHYPPEHTFKEYPRLCDPSEPEPRSEEFVLEMHLVHQTKDYAKYTAVIGVLFKLGEPNEFLDQFWDHISEVEEDESVKVDEVNVADLLLNDIYIQYTGSLTTPPYTEGVEWTVSCGKWNTISKKQLRQLRRHFPEPNNRPTQPLNGRDVSIHFPMYGTNQQKAPSLVQSS